MMTEISNNNKGRVLHMDAPGYDAAQVQVAALRDPSGTPYFSGSSDVEAVSVSSSLSSRAAVLWTGTTPTVTIDGTLDPGVWHYTRTSTSFTYTALFLDSL